MVVPGVSNRGKNNAVCSDQLLSLPKWKYPRSKKFLFQQTHFYKQSKQLLDYNKLSLLSDVKLSTVKHI